MREALANLIENSKLYRKLLETLAYDHVYVCMYDNLCENIDYMSNSELQQIINGELFSEGCDECLKIAHGLL